MRQHLFPDLVPASTGRTWIARGPRKILGNDNALHCNIELHQQLARLRRKLAVVTAVMSLLLVLVRAFQLRERLPQAHRKRDILHAIDRARPTLTQQQALRVLGITPSRYQAWRRAEQGCELADLTSCPKSSPTRATAAEMIAVKDMVTSDDYRHMPVTTLARYAARIGSVVLSASTWLRLIRDHGWKRPRLRLYPERPLLGIRAAVPNAIWHLDTTILRLTDTTRVYICAVIDNASRMILAWAVADKLSPMLTAQVLADAAKHLPEGTPQGATALFVDSGTENLNTTTDAFLNVHRAIERVLAQVEIACSNSMIEAFWRSLKHNWLYLNTLGSLAAVRNLMAFYVHQHNHVMPHSALGGRTPVEVYTGTGGEVAEQLSAARAAARAARIATNRALSCATCMPDTAPATAPPAARNDKPA